MSEFRGAQGGDPFINLLDPAIMDPESEGEGYHDAPGSGSGGPVRPPGSGSPGAWDPDGLDASGIDASDGDDSTQGLDDTAEPMR